MGGDVTEFALCRLFPMEDVVFRLFIYVSFFFLVTYCIFNRPLGERGKPGDTPGTPAGGSLHPLWGKRKTRGLPVPQTGSPKPRQGGFAPCTPMPNSLLTLH